MSESDTRRAEAKGYLRTEDETERLRQEKEELRQKCFDTSAKIQELKAQLDKEKDLTCRAQRELAKVKDHNEEISCQLERELEEKSRICMELQEKEKEIEKLSSEHCTKESCVQTWAQLQELRAEVEHLRAGPCFKEECIKQVQNLKKAEEQLASLYVDSHRKYQEIERLTAENTRKYQEIECLTAENTRKYQDIERLTAENTRLMEQCNWLKSEFENKRQQLEESKTEKDKLRSEMNAFSVQETESLKLQTCKERPCKYLKSDLLEIIGGPMQHGETQEPITLTKAMVQLASEQSKILAKLTEQQQYRALEFHDSLPCKNQECVQAMRSYQTKVDNLNRQLFSEQCQRPDCVKLWKEHRQQVVQSIGNANPGKDMDKQRAVEHDQLVHEFETLTSDLDGLLGLLENTLDNDDANFEAKRVLCTLFQEAYDRSKKIVIRTISSKLESLFEVQETKTEEMEDASRGYGLLLHAFSLRMKEMRAHHAEAIKTEMVQKFPSGDETFQKIKTTLESSSQDHLGKAIELAWKFVTLPNPLIVCQPEKYDSRIHSPEHGYWDSKQKHESNLIYTRPVVYRNYEGVLACKGWVADKVTGKQHNQRSESTCSLS